MCHPQKEGHNAHLIPARQCTRSYALVKHVLLVFPRRFHYPNSNKEATMALQEYMAAVHTLLQDRQDLCVAIVQLAKRLQGDLNAPSPTDMYLKFRRKVSPLLQLYVLEHYVEALVAALQPAVKRVAELEISSQIGLDLKAFQDAVASLWQWQYRDKQVPQRAAIELQSRLCISLKFWNKGKQWGSMVSMTLQGVSHGSSAQAFRQDKAYTIKQAHYAQLAASYNQQGNDIRPEVAIWRLLCRYTAIIGAGGLGAGWHLATPGRFLDALVRDYCVVKELFASPLNRHLPAYCSAFEDTDICFGSDGNFFKQDFSSGGSFQVGPPYEEGLMLMVCNKLLESLNMTQKPLLFICILPFWEDCEYFNALRKCQFISSEIILSRGQHYYISGMQHYCKEVHMKQSYVTDTWIVCLQNQAAFKIDLGSLVHLWEDEQPTKQPGTTGVVNEANSAE